MTKLLILYLADALDLSAGSSTAFGMTKLESRHRALKSNKFKQTMLGRSRRMFEHHREVLEQQVSV